MKKSIILLSTLAFSTVATPTVLADQLTTSASEISVQNEKEWIGISTLEFIDTVWNSSIINIDQDQVITVTGKFNFYGSNNLSPQDLMFTSNLPWISFSNVTIDNLSHTGTVQITLNTKDIEAGKNQFILRISSANNDERKNITPYSLTNVININTSSKNPAIEVPTPEVPKSEVPTPEVPTPEEDSDSKVTENLISTRNTDKLFQQATVSSNLNGVTQEKNKKILPVTGDNNNIIFEYIGFVLLGFTAILMYKKK
jgi:LPXTG-motif cell wall-anchored protein